MLAQITRIVIVRRRIVVSNIIVIGLRCVVIV